MLVWLYLGSLYPIRIIHFGQPYDAGSSKLSIGLYCYGYNDAISTKLCQKLRLYERA